MATIPFIVYLETVLGANGTGTLSYTVPPGEKLTINDLIQDATGAFEVTGIRDSSGRYYTNASPNTGIPRGAFKEMGTAFLGFDFYKTPLVIEGGLIFYIDIVDTSGAGNTVQVALCGIRETRG